jgi:hypothetical protein
MLPPVDPYYHLCMTASPQLQAPILDGDSFICPRCGAYAHQIWHVINVANVGYLEWEPEPITNRNRSLWKAAVCQRCMKPSFWRESAMVYPSASAGAPAHVDMPYLVKELYEEASTVAPHSRRAGAALARATVERLIKLIDPEAPKRASLEKRIERIERHISTPLRELLDLVRVTGNGAVHVDDEPDEVVVIALDDEEGPAFLELLLDAANNLVEELISRPRKTRELWERLPESVRAKREEPPLPPSF